MGQSIAASNHGAAIDQDKQEIKAVKGFTTDLVQLKEDMKKMSTAYDVVMNVYNDGKHSYTEALPELFILTIEKDVFSSYMQSLMGPLEKVSEIVVNHCSSYSCGKGKTCWRSCSNKNNEVLQDAKLLTDILGTQITSMNSFYQKCKAQACRARFENGTALPFLILSLPPSSPLLPPSLPLCSIQIWINSICSYTRSSTKLKWPSFAPSSRKERRWHINSTQLSTQSR